MFTPCSLHSQVTNSLILSWIGVSAWCQMPGDLNKGYMTWHPMTTENRRCGWRMTMTDGWKPLRQYCSRLGLSSWHTEAATPASRSKEISSMWRDSCIDQSRSKSPWPDGSPHASKPQSSSFNRYFSYFKQSSTLRCSHFKHSSTLRCTHFKLLRRGFQCSIIEDAAKLKFHTPSEISCAWISMNWLQFRI
jgi:hypothetical protein